MPIKACKVKGKPGYKWGESGKCYTYTLGNAASRKNAKQKAYLQGAASNYKYALANWLEHSSVNNGSA